jgi:hypothetical protein
MTTIPEREFHHYVGEWLREYFHPDCIEHEPRLEATDRIVDLFKRVVQTEQVDVLKWLGGDDA